jgi:hypothetical protein
MKSNRVHRPNPENLFTPYFDDETIKKCRNDLEKVLEHFSDDEIRKLCKALLEREVDGPFTKSDLMGTFASFKIGFDIDVATRDEQITEKRREMYARINRTPGPLYDFEYWFLQISGKPSLGKGVSDHRCVFSEMTISWCTKILSERLTSKKRETAHPCNMHEYSI